MPSILTTVTEAETKVVETIRSWQQPVVGYVRKGVELVDDRFPEITYPSSLPRPGKVIDSQVDFFKALLDAQRDLVKAVVGAVAPLAGRTTEGPERTAPAPAAPTTSAAKAKAGKTAKS
jgi:hypothetical protein